MDLDEHLDQHVHDMPYANTEAHHADAEAHHADAGPGREAFSSRPPIPLVCLTSMALVLGGGVYLASYLPRRAPLAPAVGLVAAAGVALIAAVVLVAGLRQFAWDAFFLVVRWALVAYGVIAGILEYVFVSDGTRGTMLVLLTLSLLVFAVDIPVLFGFSVARFQAPRARR